MRADVLKHLRRDKLLLPALHDFEVTSLKRVENIALYLCLSIIGQQLSTRVAQIICDRFLELLGSQEPSCELISRIDKNELRAIGLSQMKANYIHNVCAYFIENKLDDQTVHALSDDELTGKLLEIKGVGKWTIQMLLMFAMAREDVFAPDDLGLRQAMTELYGISALSNKESRQRMLEISQNWKPFRSYACLALWSWKDKKKRT